jgi:CDP-paratose 2-epimerase
MAGVNGSPQYLLDTNLAGAMNCFEFARQHQSDVFFISTSRIYPYDVLNNARFTANKHRFDYSAQQKVPGLSQMGIAESLPLTGVRSLYGATKLNAEFLLQEFAATYGIKMIINRFGCIAGPWQMGKTDQGVLALWVYRHLAKQPLSYVGFGGKGQQVRDFLHVSDACSVIDRQLEELPRLNGKIFNVGGGKGNSVSLAELTGLCQEATGQKVKLAADPETRPVDLKNYISDNRAIAAAINWQPRYSVKDIVVDAAAWMKDHFAEVSQVLG